MSCHTFRDSFRQLFLTRVQQAMTQESLKLFVKLDFQVEYNFSGYLLRGEGRNPICLPDHINGIQYQPARF